jgi:hypothetical protein
MVPLTDASKSDDRPERDPCVPELIRLSSKGQESVVECTSRRRRYDKLTARDAYQQVAMSEVPFLAMGLPVQCRCSR